MRGREREGGRKREGGREGGREWGGTCTCIIYSSGLTAESGNHLLVHCSTSLF